MRLLAIVMCVVCMTTLAHAQWNGFPFQTNTDTRTYAWDSLETYYQPISQLFWAANERCLVSGVPTITNVETWTCYGGTNFDGMNVTLLTTNIVTTNYFGYFNYTDHNGNSQVGRTHLTSSNLFRIQDKILDVYYDGNWCPVYYTNFLGITTNGAGPSLTNLVLGLEQTFYTNQVGSYYPEITNAWGIISKNRRDWAQFTRHPSSTNPWTLAECYYTNTASWRFNNVSSDRYNYQESNNYPFIKFIAGGTNSFSAMQFEISGTCRVVNATTPNNSLTTTTETVSMSDTNQVLTKLWYTITNITSSSTSGNTNDTVYIYYTNRPNVYSTAWVMVHPKLLDEMWYALDALKWTMMHNIAQSNNTFYMADNPATNAAGWSANITTFENGMNDADEWSEFPVDQYDVQMGYSTYGAEIGGKDYYYLFNSPDYDGSIGANARAQSYATNISTNYAHAQVYHFRTPDSKTNYSFWGSTYPAIWTDYITLTETNLSRTYIYSTNAEQVTSAVIGPDLWTNPATAIAPSLPVTDSTNRFYGQFFNIDATVLKWDGTNGFRFK